VRDYDGFAPSPAADTVDLDGEYQLSRIGKTMMVASTTTLLGVG
jgi:hypothetical protein